MRLSKWAVALLAVLFFVAGPVSLVGAADSTVQQVAKHGKNGAKNGKKHRKHKNRKHHHGHHGGSSTQPT